MRISGKLAVFVYGFALAVPLLTRSYLNAPIGFFSLALLVFPVAALGLAARLHADTMPWLRYLSAATNAATGVLVLVGILITPLSAYTSWFDTLKYGTPEGGVSNLFVLITAWFSAVFSPMTLTMGFLWPVIMMAFTIIYLLAIVFQTQGFLLFVMGFLVVPSLYLAFRTVVRVRRGGAVFFSLGLVAVAFVIAMAVPKFDTPPGDDFVNDQLYPELRSAVVRTVPRFPLLYAVPGYGISFDEKKLGGNPTLLPNPIFLVRGDPKEVVYLRTRIFDTYDGSSWSMSPYFAGRTTDALRNRFFGDSSQTREGDLRIELEAKNFGYLPYTLDTDTIFVDRGLPQIAEGSIDTGFNLRTPLERGDVIYLRRTEGARVATSPLSEAEARLYRQIPSDLPDELRVIADGLSRGVEDEERILTNIEIFLAHNYTYNLEIEDIAPGGPGAGDFVYSFLFSKSGGYCVQFATSFIILARLNGIPSRYATGYLTYLPPDGTEAEVTGLSAHAWPEVWVSDKGWVNWEATPAANIANYTEFADGWTFNFGVDLNPATSRQIEGLVGGSFGTDPERSDRSPGRRRGFFIVFALAVSVAAGATVFAFAFRGVRYLARDASGRCRQRLRRLARMLAKRGIVEPERTGLIAWFLRIEQRLPELRDRLESVRRLVIRLAYSGDVTGPDDLEEVTRFCRDVRNRIRRTDRNRC